VYETLASGSLDQMIPAIRNILGGFLFSGDDVYKKASVLSGGERTRLAVARMLLRPSNTLLLDEPTNHLDIDSKEVLLEALADYGGTLVFVSHDRYFVERLATKIVDVGDGRALLYPGTYPEFLWSKANGRLVPAAGDAQTLGRAERRPPPVQRRASTRPEEYEARKREAAGQRKRDRAQKALQQRILDLEGRIAEREEAIKAIEQEMAAPGFYSDHDAARPVLERHQALMWEVGDLLNQWEMLQGEASASANRES
jgi:ATP-binding cassette subfamily F protein 3